jgi:very-short-patch-repair endonuclease
MLDDTSARLRAARQHGLLSVRDLADLGFDVKARGHLVDGRRWERIAPRVVRLVGARETTAQRAMRAVLEAGTGGALAGRSAAAWWGISGNSLEPFEVVRDRGHAGRAARGSGRHEPCLLPADHVRILDDIPLVVPARALFEIAGTRRRGAEIAHWVDRMARMTYVAWSDRLVSGRSLHSMLEDLAQRGRSGIRVMRQVLADRPIDYVPPASGLESRLAQILQRAGERPLRRQIDTGDGRSWIGRVDFRDDELPLIVEVQSERFHTSLTASEDDAVRLARLRLAGFSVLEVTDVDVWQRPDRVVNLVAEARRHLCRAA